MNERHLPSFTHQEIIKRMVRLEGLMGKTIDQHPACLELIADVVIQLARECNLIHDPRLK